MVRWFQYGVWCPLFRLHGDRLPRGPLSQAMSGGPNEVWSYGDEAYAILADILRSENRSSPTSSSRWPSPPTRAATDEALWFDFPDDATVWTIEDQYLFGPSV